MVPRWFGLSRFGALMSSGRRVVGERGWARSGEGEEGRPRVTSWATHRDEPGDRAGPAAMRGEVSAVFSVEANEAVLA